MQVFGRAVVPMPQRLCYTEAINLAEDEAEQYLAGNQHLVGLFEIDVEALVQKKRTSAPKLPIWIEDADSQRRKV